DRIYLKLALLHDSGKGNITFLRRVKKVLIGDEKLEKHPQNAFEKLKKIDIELAKLCRDHHKKNVENKMKIFQKIDDE
ncbi:MAG: HD domain-containing protein, partial [Cetobacterium sp.]